MSEQLRHEDPGSFERLYRSAEARAVTRLDALRQETSSTSNRPDVSAAALLFATAQAELERRTARAEAGSVGLSTDLGWAIVLELFVAGHSARVVSLTGCGARWKVSDATAARQIAALLECGLVRRTATDAGEVNGAICLTPFGKEVLAGVLNKMTV